jgi:hypothetical protein
MKEDILMIEHRHKILILIYQRWVHLACAETLLSLLKENDGKTSRYEKGTVIFMTAEGARDYDNLQRR